MSHGVAAKRKEGEKLRMRGEGGVRTRPENEGKRRMGRVKTWAMKGRSRGEVERD